MAALSDPLAGLRDIHIPEPPPAGPGDVLLLAITVCALLLAGLLLARFIRRPAWKSEALQELDAAVDSDPRERLFRAASVLRRLALRDAPHAAKLSGDAWLAHLDGLFATRFFTVGEGRVFGEGLYRPGSMSNDGGRLIGELKRLVRRMRRRS